MYLSSNKANKDAERKLLLARSVTSTHISLLSKWYVLRIPDSNVTLETLGLLAGYVNSFGVKILVQNVSLEENIGFYTKIIVSFLDVVANVISVPRHDRLLIALDSLLRASDNLGIQRALGSSYWSPCEFPRSKPLWFSNLVSQSGAYLEQSFRFHEPSFKIYTANLQALHPLPEMLKNGSDNMLNPEYASECRNMTIAERFEMGALWFDNMTTYMNKALNPVKKALIEDLLLQLRRTSKETKNSVSLLN